MNTVDLRAIAQLHMAGELESAEQGYRQAISQGLRDAMVYSNLGIICQESGRSAEALSLWQMAVEINPGFAEAYNNIGNALITAGSIEQGLEYCRRAVDLNPKFARALSNMGNAYTLLRKFKEAKACYRKAISLDKGYANAHANLGEVLRQQGFLDKALVSYRKALQLDPQHNLAQFGLAACTGTAVSAAPSKYVQNLFNGYADKFDDHLQKGLKYAIPRQIAGMISARVKNLQFGRVLDLGCGTGLVGEALKGCALQLVGVDLSEKMLERAAAKDIYHELHHADIANFLRSQEQPYELVVAADVFVYIGNLFDIFQEVRRLSSDDALFAFSVESARSGDYQILPSGRFAHTDEYLIELCDRTNFSIDMMVESVIRVENGKPVQGKVVLLHRSA